MALSYHDLKNGQMKERMEFVLQRLEKHPMYVDNIHPDVLKRLKKKNLIKLERILRGTHTSRIIAHSTRKIKEPERIPEPYKKRREALKEAGLRYRKSF